MGRILLAGAPRSGTSWTGRALGRCSGVRYVDEPDGFRDAYAFRVMMEYGENPAARPGDVLPAYERLWAGAFSGGRPASGVRQLIAARAYHHAGTPARRRARAGDGTSGLLRLAMATARPPVADPTAGHVVVKSVQCCRSIEWVVDRFAPRVLVLLRHPLNAIASWREMGFVRNPRENASLAAGAAARWGVTAPDPDAPQLAQQAFVYAVLTNALTEAASRHPDWIVARHEELCRDSVVELRLLATRLGVEWTDAAEEFVIGSDRAGSGFATARIAAEQADRWRERLSPEDVDVIRRVLDQFPTGTDADR